MSNLSSLSQQDALFFAHSGFQNDAYISAQRTAISDRIERFQKGKLYLEIGGKFLFDAHASRVLPGFSPSAKREILSSFSDRSEILFCVDFYGLSENRQLGSNSARYEDEVFRMAKEIYSAIHQRPKMILNRCPNRDHKSVKRFLSIARDRGFSTFLRFEIQGYPHDLDAILSETGFGADDYIPTEKPLVLVTGPASNSGKMSTCLGQIFLDHRRGIKSGYAKYETFPIWNLPLDHPVNIAYEAATADIGDRNMIDPFHQKAYGITSVNYNRDVEAFEIVMNVARCFVDADNPMNGYQSPTDMGINTAGDFLIDEEIIREACIAEVSRRRAWYQQMTNRGEGNIEWVRRCEALLSQIQKKK